MSITFSEAKNFIITNKFSEENDFCFRAAVIIWWAINNNTWDMQRIHKVSGYSKKEIRTVIDNLKREDLLFNGALEFNYDAENDLGNVIELTLIFMAGAGQIRRYIEYQPQVEKIRSTPVEKSGLLLKDFRQL